MNIDQLSKSKVFQPVSLEEKDGTIYFRFTVHPNIIRLINIIRHTKSWKSKVRIARRIQKICMEEGWLK